MKDYAELLSDKLMKDKYDQGQVLELDYIRPEEKLRDHFICF